MSLEQTIIKLAEAKLDALRILAKSHIERADVYLLLSEFTSITDIHRVKDNGLSDDGHHQLKEVASEARKIIADLQGVYIHMDDNDELITRPDVDEAVLKKNMDMSAQSLLDYLFKEGGIFSDKDAVTVAIYRGLYLRGMSEKEAYERLKKLN